MRTRLNHLRSQLAQKHARLSPLGGQRGMFATLPIAPSDIVRLREQHGIYMAGSGRINIAGLRDETVPLFTECLGPLLNLQTTLAEQI